MTWSPSSVASGAASALAPPTWISATSPASSTAASAACSARRKASGSPVRATSWRRWSVPRMVARPAAAPIPSTAVCTTISSSPTRSSPAANDSPTRRIASCSRPRSRWSSSSRPSSWRAIELNSLPRAANSSLPSAGTVTEKSPLPSRCAATSRRWISDCRRRETATAKTNASARKPKKAAAANSEAGPSGSAVSRSGSQQADLDLAADRRRPERVDPVVGPLDVDAALVG